MSMSLQGKKRGDDDVVISSHEPMEGYRSIGDEEEPVNHKNNAAACLMCLGVLSIMIFFIVTAVKDYTPSSPIDLDAFKQDFGPFLQALSFEPSDSYMNLSLALLDKYPDFFLSYLALSMAYKASNNTEQANDFLQQARDSGDGDDYFSLLPSPQEFDDSYPAQSLIQLSDKVWAVPYYYKIDENQPFSLFEAGYLFLLSNDTLVFFNPVPLTMAVLSDLLKATNNVSPSHLIETTKQHYQALPAAQKQWNGTKSYGVQAQKDYDKTKDLSWDGFLNDTQPLFPDDFTQITLNGQDNDECAFYHTASKTVLLADILMDSVVSNVDNGNYVPGTTNNQTSFFNRLYYWTYGSFNSLNVPNYQSTFNLISDPTAFSNSIQKITNLDINQLLLINGGLLTNNVGASLQNAFASYVITLHDK